MACFGHQRWGWINLANKVMDDDTVMQFLLCLGVLMVLLGMFFDPGPSPHEFSGWVANDDEDDE